MTFKQFTEYLLHEKNYSALTVKAYQTDLENFSEFILKQYDSNTINDVNYSQIRSWIVNLVEDGITNRTINRKVSSLNSYYKFLLLKFDSNFFFLNKSFIKRLSFFFEILAILNFSNCGVLGEYEIVVKSNCIFNSLDW